MALIVDVATALVNALNQGSFSLAFQAERSYLPRYELPELADLRVTVVARELTAQPANRGTHYYDVAADVGIQRRLAGAATSATALLLEVDGLLGLVEEITDYLLVTPLAGVALVDLQAKPVYALEHLEELRQFTAVLTARYRARR